MCEGIIWYMCVPFWLRLLVPALMVIVAVTVTQYIFHKNARLRENRERQLKIIDKAAEEIKSAQIDCLKYVIGGHNENPISLYSDIIIGVAHIPRSVKAYIKSDIFHTIEEFTSTLITDLKEIHRQKLQNEKPNKTVTDRSSMAFVEITDLLRLAHLIAEKEG